MKRRQAIRQIVVVSSGLALLPSCDFQSTFFPYKKYQHLALDREQYQLIEALQAAILAPEKMPTSTTETPLDYILTRINDCYDMEDLEKYIKGLKDFQEDIKSKSEEPFKKLKPEQQTQILSDIFLDENTSPIKDFLETNKKLSIEYFTRSEDYQVNHFEYEFVPSRYSACVDI